MTSRPRVLFMGSPAFAVPALSMLAERPDLCEVVAVVCQPDKPAGRGRKLTPCAVKVAAQARGIPVLEPRKMKSPETAAALAEYKPDIAVVAAYGRILPRTLLDIPKHGCINIHASLLPRHRGASPIAHAIWFGDEEAGVGIMRMEEGLDTGPVYAESRCPIAEDDTCGSLTVKLAKMGAELLLEALPKIVGGELAATAQEDDAATYAPLLKKSDGALDFGKSAMALGRQVRALDPWPGTFAFKGEQRVQVLKVEVLADGAGDVLPGEVVRAGGKGIDIACGEGILRLLDVKPAGKKAMAASAWAAGRGIAVGERLSLKPAV